MKKLFFSLKLGPLCFCGGQGINESKHILVRQILPSWEIKYDSVACLFLKARNLKMNLFFYCTVWWDMDSFVWRVFSLWVVAHEQISIMESHKGFCCHRSDRISLAFLWTNLITFRNHVFFYSHLDTPPIGTSGFFNPGHGAQVALAKEVRGRTAGNIQHFIHRIHETIVYLPTWMVDFYGTCREIIPYMDPMRILYLDVSKLVTYWIFFSMFGGFFGWLDIYMLYYIHNCLELKAPKVLDSSHTSACYMGGGCPGFIYIYISGGSQSRRIIKEIYPPEI